jgi:hypothetical protein
MFNIFTVVLISYYQNPVYNTAASSFAREILFFNWRALKKLRLSNEIFYSDYKVSEDKNWTGLSK